MIPERRSFTPEQANRMLPLVQRIVADIVEQFDHWKAAVSELELESASNTVAAPNPRAESLEREVASIAAEIERFRRELTALGVEFKDPEMGLVDFPSEREGRSIYLCWRLGEREVDHWHELYAGYAGRQPIDHRVTA
jgi:hypothetical protein